MHKGPCLDDLAEAMKALDGKNVHKGPCHSALRPHPEEKIRHRLFCEVLTALGISFDVGKLHEGIVTIDNTESRRCELAQTLNEIVRSRT